MFEIQVGKKQKLHVQQTVFCDTHAHQMCAYKTHLQMSDDLLVVQMWVPKEKRCTLTTILAQRAHSKSKNVKWHIVIKRTEGAKWKDEYFYVRSRWGVYMV